MTTDSVINQALESIAVLSSGDTPTTDESASCLLILQAILAAWSADELTVFATRTAAITMVAATASYAISGARPVKILSADHTIAGVNKEVDVIGAQAWAAMPDKSATSPQAKAVYCDYAYPTPAILVTPIPTATATLNLYCMVDLATVASGGATFDMPEGYLLAIRYNLAVALCPMFGKAVPDAVQTIAITSKAALRRLNASDKAGASALEIPPTGDK